MNAIVVEQFHSDCKLFRIYSLLARFADAVVELYIRIISAASVQLLLSRLQRITISLLCCPSCYRVSSVLAQSSRTWNIPSIKIHHGECLAE